MTDARRQRLAGRPFAPALTAALLVLVALSAGAPPPAHADGATLAIDADISDGACVDIDAAGTTTNSSTQVAICLDNPGSVPVAAFQYSVLYDDTLVVANEVADVAPSLDDNPDANAGSTTYTSSSYPNTLGTGWTCDGGVGAHPKGDRDLDTGPGQGDAYSGGCVSVPGPVTLTEGPLGVVTFTILAAFGQPASLTLNDASVTDDNINEIGSCAPVEDTPMICVGATIVREEGPPPEPEMGLYFDLDTSDGVCAAVQNNPSRTVDAGTSFDVAACFKNRTIPPPETLVGFNYHVLYNDTIIRVPEMDDSGTGNDDNPDANAGSTTFGSSNLGAAWVCNFGGTYPKGDIAGLPFDGSGQARSGSCGWPNYPSPPNSGMSQGALGVLHLKTGAPGTTSLSFTSSSGVTPYSSGTGLTFSCASSSAPLFCYGASITVLCVQPDAECDGADDGIDNCLGLYNPDQFNTDSDPRDNGPLAPGDDATSMTTDAPGDACDNDDDNDGISDADEAVHPVPGCPSATAALNPLALDSDGDHHHDGWECANGSDPANAASNFPGTLGNPDDVDGDRVKDLWEQRGYNGTGASTDSDGDGCHDMVEVASIDGNKTITQADYLAVARRALNIWGPNAAQDYVLDIDKNGVVADPDRLFVTRAALLPDWLPKSCP